ncbi:hypothetical protein [Streptomyces sp. DT203]|uniref:hypothetical protein n=1 Tax=Streptomyces sp. DT203 TaxID=3393424 RepID=UPI003CF4D1C5
MSAREAEPKEGLRRTADRRARGSMTRGGAVGNGGNNPFGKPPVKAGGKQSKAAKRAASEQRRREDLQRKQALRDAEFAREAERRRNGLGDTPVRAEKMLASVRIKTKKPKRPRGKPVRVPGELKPASAKRSRKAAVAASLKDFPASRPARVADRGVDRRDALPKVASAYMRLSPEEMQRERRIRQNREKRAAERLAQKQAQK